MKNRWKYLIAIISCICYCQMLIISKYKISWYRIFSIWNIYISMFFESHESKQRKTLNNREFTHQNNIVLIRSINLYSPNGSIRRNGWSINLYWHCSYIQRNSIVFLIKCKKFSHEINIILFIEINGFVL